MTNSLATLTASILNDLAYAAPETWNDRIRAAMQRAYDLGVADTERKAAQMFGRLVDSERGHTPNVQKGVEL